jgi:hypothetical protein
MTLTAFLNILMWVALFRYFYVRKHPIESIIDEIAMIMWQLNISCISYLLIRAVVFSWILPFLGYL